MMCCLMKDADPHLKIYGTDVSTCEKTIYLGKVLRTNNTYEMVFITRYSGHLKYYKERKNHFQKEYFLEFGLQMFILCFCVHGIQMGPSNSKSTYRHIYCTMFNYCFMLPPSEGIKRVVL